MKKLKSIRWTLEKAAAEFGRDRKTIGKRIRDTGAQAGADGCFTTRQIAEAIYGALEKERIRLLTVQADLAEMEKKKMSGSMMDAALVEQEWSTVILVCRQKLLGLASKVAPRLAYAKDAAAMELEIQKDIEEALTELGKPMSYGMENNEPKE